MSVKRHCAHSALSHRHERKGYSLCCTDKGNARRTKVIDYLHIERDNIHQYGDYDS